PPPGSLPLPGHPWWYAVPRAATARSPPSASAGGASCWDKGPYRRSRTWLRVLRPTSCGPPRPKTWAADSGIWEVSAWRLCQNRLAFYRLAVSAFSRRRHENRLGHVAARENGRPVSAFLTLGFRPDGFQHFIGRDRNLVNANPYRVINRVGNRGRNRQLRSLSGFLRPERAVWIRVFYQIG